jgi:hypothetical protein
MAVIDWQHRHTVAKQRQSLTTSTEYSVNKNITTGILNKGNARVKVMPLP